MLFTPTIAENIIEVVTCAVSLKLFYVGVTKDMFKLIVTAWKRCKVKYKRDLGKATLNQRYLVSILCDISRVSLH